MFISLVCIILVLLLVGKYLCLHYRIYKVDTNLKDNNEELYNIFLESWKTMHNLYKQKKLSKKQFSMFSCFLESFYNSEYVGMKNSSCVFDIYEYLFLERFYVIALSTIFANKAYLPAFVCDLKTNTLNNFFIYYQIKKGFILQSPIRQSSLKSCYKIIKRFRLYLNNYNLELNYNNDNKALDILCTYFNDKVEKYYNCREIKNARYAINKFYESVNDVVSYMAKNNLMDEEAHRCWSLNALRLSQEVKTMSYSFTKENFATIFMDKDLLPDAFKDYIPSNSFDVVSSINYVRLLQRYYKSVSKTETDFNYPIAIVYWKGQYYEFSVTKDTFKLAYLNESTEPCFVFHNYDILLKAYPIFEDCDVLRSLIMQYTSTWSK